MHVVCRYPLLGDMHLFARLLTESEAAHHSLDTVQRQASLWCQQAQIGRPR